MSSVTNRLRLDFHHIKVDFKKSEVDQPLASGVDKLRSLHTESEIFVRNVCKLKNKYDLRFCQSR